MGMKKFWEDMSGTSKQKYGPDLYDPKEFKKWKDRQEEIYGKIGAAGDRYGTQAEKFLGLYGKDRAEADRYRGLAETKFGKSEEEIERARGVFGRARGDIQTARGHQLRATELMSDRDHYANLKRRSMSRHRAAQNARLELEAIRGRMGKPSRDTSLTRTLLDAFKRTTESNRKIIEANARELTRGGNQVAAARMTQEFNEGTLKSLGQIKQKGMFSDQELHDSKLTREAGMVMNETSLINAGATEDQIANAIHTGQIRDRLAAGTASLNTANAMGNLGRNYLSGADRFANLGQQYSGMGNQLDSRGATALNMTSRYEGLNYGTLQDRMSISNKRVASEEKKRLSDLAARRRIDSFNSSRGMVGIQNAFKGVRTVASVVAAGATSGGSLALEAYLRSKEKTDPPPSVSTPYRTDIDPDLSMSNPDTNNDIRYYSSVV